MQSRMAKLAKATKETKGVIFNFSSADLTAPAFPTRISTLTELTMAKLTLS